jgi:hypothetical protein
MPNPDSSTEYTTLREALYGWAKLNDRQDVWYEIEVAVTSLSESLGKVIRIHVPAANSYVALTFENEPTKIGAYVNVGHIDHIAKVDGSYVPESAPAYWRSPLTTTSGSRIGSDDDSVETQLCPNCFMQVSVYGECGCGWKPA